MQSARKLALAQLPNNAPAEKPDSAENGDSAYLHGLPGLTATNRRSQLYRGQ
jgi:hypothetical protein